ncbi:MAG TPA: M23 family metallopeptidase [Gaiellaceae bacterium]|nr:M23 family metallopeptidase [Gaiellaceae bacterium]
MRAGLYLALIVAALASSTTAGATSGVPPLLFPVVGAVTYTDDFGQARPGGPHQGNDLLAKKRAPVVAVEDGTVEYWTTSAGAGCMLYLHGDSGTMYEYIHLNNDLTAGNDNKGKCVRGVAYTVADRTHVTAGEQIGYVGDSGDANGIHPHLHFEVHPKGGKAVSPYPFLQKAAHLLVPAPRLGSLFTLRLTGIVVSADARQLTIMVAALTAWPSHLKQSKLGRLLTLTLPTGSDSTFVPGEQLVAWTLPALGTLEALTGVPGALSLDRSLPL